MPSSISPFRPSPLHLSGRLLLALVVTLAWAVPSAAHPPAPPPAGEFGEEVEVTEVLLDVVVTDEDGNVVVGLGPEDFVVEEDGEPVEVTSATFFGTGGLGGEATRGAEAAPRFFVLFLHDQRQVSPRLAGPMLEAVRWTKRWVEEELLPDDWVAVVSFSASLRVQQDFTRDKREVLEAIEDAAVHAKTPGNFASRQPEEGPSLLRGLPTGKALRRSAHRVQQGIELVAEALDALPGRKNLVLFSIGFGEIDGGVYTPDPRFYDPMMQALNDARVAVYAIDTLPTGRGGNIAGRISNDSLSNLASDTGGRYFWHFNNFAVPLRQVTEDAGGYYVLSYRSGHPRGEAGFQEVDVETRDESLEVRAREGYRYGGEGRGR